MIHDNDRRLLRWGTALLAGLMLAGPAAAQESDFLFHRPSVTLGVRLGYAVPRAESEIFDFTRQELTLDKSDFNAFSIEGEVAVRAIDRIDVALALGLEKSEARSEFRDFIGEDDLPIEQDTRLTRVPMTAGVKAYPLERGRSVGRFAWIPNRWAPWVGAGGGLMWYRFEQVGEFVDFETLEIFFDEFRSDGATPMAYVAGGMDVSLGPRWLVTGEARYAWASAGMGRDFVGFDDIDLAGFRVALGFSARL